jgi:transcription initiation factor TFIIB
MVLQENTEVYLSAAKDLKMSYSPAPETGKDPFRGGCPQCKADKKRIVKDHDNGEICCSNCGYVITSEMDLGPEWRAYNSQQNDQKSRTGPPSNILFHDKGLGTVIPTKNIDFYGNKLSQESIQTLNRIRRWNVRSRVNGTLEKSIIYNNNEIDLICIGMDGRIPRATQKTAVGIMTRMTKGEQIGGKRKSLIRGRSRKALSKAATVIAARKSGLPVTMNDMVYADGSVSRKELSRAYRDLVKSGVQSSAQRPEALIRYYASNLCKDDPGASSTMETIASRILKGASSTTREDGSRCAPLMSGKSPASMAAAMVYMSGIIGGQKHTQKDVAEAAKVTKVTVRNRYKDILDRLIIECSI